jgi:transcriptional regulator with XRE-family HTH domain
MNVEKTQFGAFVARRRREQGLTQKALAEKLHVTDKAVSKWERGLSYPDVTLLEPLAETFGLGVTELVACREAEEPDAVRDTEVRDLLEISGDSLRRERRRRRRWVLVLSLLLLAAAAALVLVLTLRDGRIAESGLLAILHTEAEGDRLLAFTEHDGSLLRLAFDPAEDPDRQIAPGAWIEAEYRWDRRTRRGELLRWRLREDVLGTPMDEVGASQDLYVQDGDALFGFPRVMVKCVSRQRSPDGSGYLSFYVFSRGDDSDQWYLHPLEELVRTRNALGYGTYGDGGWRVLDADGDGVRELLVRTPWPEKPCILYDWVDGAVAETWLDVLPDAMLGPAE